MDMNFCRRCGTALSQVDGHVYRCKNDHTIFANAAPGVGIFFITPDNHVLLSQRGIEPHKGMLDVFGGFLDGQETFVAAAIRELQEELSLQPDEYEPLTYLTSSADVYPYKGEVIPYSSVLFWSKLITKRRLTPSDDVAAIKKLPLHELDISLFHANDVRYGIRALQRIFPEVGSNA